MNTILNILFITTTALSLNAQEVKTKTLDVNDPNNEKYLKMASKWLQQQDSLHKVDYFNYSYKNLDKDFNIIISDAKFQKALTKYNYNPDAVKFRMDSLEIALLDEFDNDDIVQVAKKRVYHTWKMMSRYLDYSVEQTKSIASKIGLKHPNQLHRFLIGQTELFSLESIDIKNKERERAAIFLASQTDKSKEDFLNLADKDLFNKLYALRK